MTRKECVLCLSTLFKKIFLSIPFDRKVTFVFLLSIDDCSVFVQRQLLFGLMVSFTFYEYC